jgi:nuclear transcription factor Y, gamma
MTPTLTELKNHPLPLARIKKIMKSDEDVRMISSEAPVLFAKACELFILELTHRAWAFSEANKRRTLQHNDITAAILNHEHEVFEFLVCFFADFCLCLRQCCCQALV